MRKQELKEEEEYEKITPKKYYSAKGKEEMEDDDDDDVEDLKHPVTSYYRDYHQPVYGKVPYHHIEALNKGYGRAETKYPGDPKKVLELFNLYSGRSVIGCDACGAKKKKKQRKQVPVERRLIPISSAAAASVAPQKKLIPIDSVGLPLPPLIRLDAPAAATTPSERPLPRLIPIGSEMPRLVPIDSKLPQLIKMGAADFADDYEPTLEDFM